MIEINQKWKIGDCQDLMSELDPDSIDLIVTDSPYFMIDKNGNGFMGKSWDSINTDNVHNILCNSKEFVQFVIKFFMLMKVESNTDEENIVQSDVKIKGVNQQRKSNVSVRSAEKNSVDNDHKLKVNMCSVHEIVLTKDDLLGLLNGLPPNHITAIENLSDNVLFVVPISYIVKNLKNIVHENVLKLPTKITCVESKIQLTSMDEARINGVIEGLIGMKSENLFTNEITIPVKSAGITVNEKKFKRIILSDTEKQKTIHWIIWLLYVLSVTQQSNTIQKSFTKSDLIYDLIYKFHTNWLSAAYRVLKPGSFAFVMSSPRQDVLSQMINATKAAGFETGFTSIYWAFSSGFPKASNVSKLIDKRLGVEREVIGTKVGQPGYSLAPEKIDGTRGNVYQYSQSGSDPEKECQITTPATLQAKALDGAYSGFQPKPAVEIVMVVMKPLEEKTYIDQAMVNGHGCIWLDDGRIPYQSDVDKEGARFGTQMDIRGGNFKRPNGVKAKNVLSSSTGRFPANLLINDDILNDGKERISKYGKSKESLKNSIFIGSNYGEDRRDACNEFIGDSGSFSRYFDLDAWWDERIKQLPKEAQRTFPFLIIPKAGKSEKGKDNTHPTVKPVKLFSWLITIGSRKNDLILDPFLGSGTTLEAGRFTDRQVIGFEISNEWEHLYPNRCMGYVPPLSNYI